MSKDIMLDIETLGKRTSAPIIAIGAVSFNLQERKIFDKFKVVVDFETDIRNGAIMEPSTVRWWLRQSEETICLSFDEGHMMSIGAALLAFNGFCGKFSNKDDLRVWGNGVGFDNVILREAYERAGLQAPWQFWNDNCYRTIKQRAPNLCIVHEGVYHNSVDDAESQVKHLFQICDLIGINS